MPPLHRGAALHLRAARQPRLRGPVGLPLLAFIILYAIYSLWMTTRPPGSTPPVPPSLLRPLASFFSGAVGTLFGAMASIFFAMYLDASGRSEEHTSELQSQFH